MCMGNELTDKQKRFCEEYLVDFNITRAGERAGYKERTVFRLIKDTNVQQYIKEMMQELKSARIADATEVMEYLTSVMRGEAKEEETVVSASGVEAMEVSPSTKDRLKAAELLGKRHRLFTDKVEVSAAVPVVIYGSDELEE